MKAAEALKQYRENANATAEGREMMEEFNSLSMKDRVELAWHMVGNLSASLAAIFGDQLPEGVIVRYQGEEPEVN